MSNTYKHEVRCTAKYIVAGREFDTKFDAELYLQAVRIADAAEELNLLFSEGKLKDVGKALYRLDVGMCECLVEFGDVISSAAKELRDMRQLEAAQTMPVPEAV